MKKKLSLSENLLVGSLLFGLFFGAGNLIFPLELGQKAGVNLPYLIVGFLLSAVSLPILAVVATAASDSESLLDLARPAGKKFAYFFTVLLYLSIGPGFAIPRTASTSFELIFEDLPRLYNQQGLFIFSLIFFIMVLFFALKEGSIMDTIGKFLSPVFLVLISALITITIIKPAGPLGEAIHPSYEVSPLAKGFVDGYNTLDAPAGLAFAIIIVESIKSMGIRDNKAMAFESLKSSFICLLAMSAIYGGLAYMGSISVNISEGYSNGAIILSDITSFYLGGFGKLALSLIVFIACLKTAIGLVCATAEIFVKIFKQRVSYKTFAIIFTLLSFGVANLGLEQIISLSLPVLMFIYPLSIVLIFLSIGSIYIGKREGVYKLCLTVTGIFAFLDFLRALAGSFGSLGPIDRVLEFSAEILPGFDLGFAWVLPALVSFIIGLFLSKSRHKNK